MVAVRAARERLNLRKPKQIGQVSYRIAEKVVLLHRLQKASKILNSIYDAAISKLISEPSANIYASAEIWKAFKNRYFGGLTSDQAHFVNPLLAELDHIAEVIEEMEE